MRSPPFDQAPWPNHLEKWAADWDVAGIENRVSLVASSRMRVSLGLYVPRRREIRIADFLLDASASLLLEVVCHEFAHAAVHERFGRACRPHGPEWRAFMRRAGCEPRVRIPGAELDRLVPTGGSGRVAWLHRCPVCLAERVGGRPVQNWRCVACTSLGRSGRLEIERLGGPSRVARRGRLPAETHGGAPSARKAPAWLAWVARRVRRADSSDRPHQETTLPT